MLSHCFSSLGLHRGQEIHCYFWSRASFLPIYWKKLGRKLLSLSKCRWLVEQDFSITIFASTWHARFCRGGSRIFLGGGALISCSTSTPINHIVFFFRIPVVLENRRSSQRGRGGGGGHTSSTLPLDPPLFCALLSGLFDWIMLGWVWFDRSLSPTQVRCQNNNYCLWLLRVIKNGEVTSSTRELDPHKQLWVV